MNQKDFANIILVVIIVVLIGTVGYFAFVKKSEPVAQQLIPTFTQTKTPVSLTPTQTPKATEAPSITFSENSHISFQYPSDWKVGKFEHYPNEYSLQPSDKFTPGAKSNNIYISITGHCMNTQCLTVYSLDDMVREFGATVISRANAKNVSGYKVQFADGKTGYMFIKSDDLVTISTDIYPTYMDKIVPTLQLLAKE